MATAQPLPNPKGVTYNIESGLNEENITIDEAYERIKPLFEDTSEGLKSTVADILDNIKTYIHSITNSSMNPNRKRALLQGSGPLLSELQARGRILEDKVKPQFDMYIRVIERHIFKTTKEARERRLEEEEQEQQRQLEEEEEEKRKYLEKIAALFGGKRRTRKQKRKRSLKRKPCKKN